MQDFLQGLRDPDKMPTALRVALVVGTILFSINHGNVLLKGKMERSRWISGLLTYAVPYCVSIHGQVSSQRKLQRLILENSNPVEERQPVLEKV